MSYSNPRTRRMSMSYAPRKRAKTMASSVTRAAEVKEFIGTGVIANILPGGNLITNLGLGIVKGTQGNERIGNRIRIKSIEVTGSLGTPQQWPNSVTLYRSEAINAFTTADYFGPFIYKESAATYDYFINDAAGGGSTFKFKKSFTGAGMEMKFDKDTGDTNTGVRLLFANNNTTNQTNGYYWWKVRYIDV